MLCGDKGGKPPSGSLPSQGGTNISASMDVDEQILEKVAKELLELKKAPDQREAALQAAHASKKRKMELSLDQKARLEAAAVAASAASDTQVG